MNPAEHVAGGLQPETTPIPTAGRAGEGTARHPPPQRPTTHIAIAEHDIHVLLDFPCVQTTHLPDIKKITPSTLDRASPIAWVHPSRPDTDLSDEALFQPASLKLQSDLHAVTRQILAATAPQLGAAPNKSPLAIPCLGLTDSGLRLLNGDLARPAGNPQRLPASRPGHGVALPLSEVAKARIAAGAGGDAPVLSIAVQSLHLLSFPSETGMALLHLRLRPETGPVLAHLEEALQVITNVSRPHVLGWNGEAQPTGRFTLLDLVHALLPAGCRASPSSRLFTYTYAQLAPGTPLPAMQAAAWRLSRHYTDAYPPGPDHLHGTSTASEFTDVVHAASLEGIATVTAPGTRFMQTNFRARIEGCYLPLAVMGFHEHVQLLRMAQDAALSLHEEPAATRKPPPPHPEPGWLGRWARRKGETQGGGQARHDGRDARQEQDARQAQVLRSLIDQFLRFRLRYSLPLVSNVTMHNHFYAAVRAGLDIERLIRKLSEDTAEASRWLAARQRTTARQPEAAEQAEHARRERRRAPLLGILNAQLTVLTTLALGKEVLAVLDIHKDAWALAAAVLAALGSYWLTSSRHRDVHRAHHGTEGESEEDRELETEVVLTTVEGSAAE